jgi:transposase
MPKPADLNRCLASLDQESTIIAVIEMSQSSWLVAGVVPGIERHPLKKLAPDQDALLRLLHRWREEAGQAGRGIRRITVAFEAGRDGFWLARWLRAHGVEAHVIHPASVAVSREHRRAKTDRLDTARLKGVFLGWLRGEPDHCHMVAIPTLEEEDARRPNRERENLIGERTRIVNRMKACLARLGIRSFTPTLRKAPEQLSALRTPEGVPLPPNTLDELQRDLARLHLVGAQIKAIETARLERLQQAPEERSHAMVRLLTRVIGIGIETADMLVHEILSRDLRDRTAVARYAGLPGSRDESGKRRRENGPEGRQCPCSARHDPARMALPQVPEGQCASAVVSGADGRRSQRHAQNHDRRPRAQAAHRALATGADRRDAGRRRPACGHVSG